MAVSPLTGCPPSDADDLVRLLGEHSRDVIFRLRVGVESGFEYISPACTAVTGYSPADFYADPSLWSGLTHPDDAYLLAAPCLEEEGRPVQRRLRWLHRDGQVVWVELRQRCIVDSAGEVVVIEGCARDISEYANTESRLRLLGTALEVAGNAVVIASPQGVIEWVNPAFTRLTGYSADEAVGQRTSLLRSGRHDDRFYRSLWETISAGRSWSGEMINRRKDGTLYHEDQTITPVIDNGVVRHYVAIKQDVSARVERERERETLLTMTAALRTARTRDQMLPTLLSHTMVLLKATGAALAIRDSLSDDAIFELGVGSWSYITGKRLPPGLGVTGQVISSARPYRHENLQDDPSVVRYDYSGEHKAAACVPLRVHDTVLGALWIASAFPIDDSDLRLLAGIADMAANAIQRTTLFEQTERRLRRLTGLHTIDQAITASLDQRLSLSVVVDQATQQLGVDAANVLLLNNGDHTLDYAVGRGFRSAYGLGVRMRLGEGLAGRAVQERRRIVVGDLHEHRGFVARQDLIGAEQFRAYVATPLVAQGQVLGVLEIYHRSTLTPDVEWLDYLDALAGRAAVAIDNAELFGRLQRSHADLELAYDTTLEGWSRALDLRDKETEGHSQRVTELTVRLARAMGLGECDITHIRRGALLHDIGKVGIPDAILLKPGPLTDEEWTIMRRHPIYSYELLSPITYLRPALDIPYAHHERWDGSGYPRGLAGEDIPLAARLFAVIDVWDALRSDRPYRKAWESEAVRSYIQAQAGRHFDPRVVEAFLQLAPE